MSDLGGTLTMQCGERQRYRYTDSGKVVVGTPVLCNTHQVVEPVKSYAVSWTNRHPWDPDIDREIYEDRLIEWSHDV